MPSYTVNSEKKPKGSIARFTQKLRRSLRRKQEKQQEQRIRGKAGKLYEAGKEHLLQKPLSEKEYEQGYFVAASTVEISGLIKFTHKEDKYAGICNEPPLPPTCGSGPHGAVQCPEECVLCNAARKKKDRPTKMCAKLNPDKEEPEFQNLNLAISIIPNYASYQYHALNQSVKKLHKIYKTNGSRSYFFKKGKKSRKIIPDEPCLCPTCRKAAVRDAALTFDEPVPNVCQLKTEQPKDSNKQPEPAPTKATTKKDLNAVQPTTKKDLNAVKPTTKKDLNAIVTTEKKPTTIGRFKCYPVAKESIKIVQQVPKGNYIQKGRFRCYPAVAEPKGNYVQKGRFRCYPAVVEAAKDAQQPTKEAQEPTKDVQQPTKDAQEPTKDAQRPTKDAQEPTKDAQRPTKDAQGTTKDAQQPTKDVQLPTKDAQEISNSNSTQKDDLNATQS